MSYKNMRYLYENTSVLFTKTCDSHKYFDYKNVYKEHFPHQNQNEFI